MQLYNIITVTPQYRSAKQHRVTQPTFKALEIPPENELLDAIRKNKLDPSVVDKETGKTMFYILVEQNLSTAINFICAKPQLCKDVINIPYEGKTPLDIARDSRMANMLQARNAKHYADLTEEEKSKGVGVNRGVNRDVNITNEEKPQTAPEIEIKTEQQTPAKQNKSQTNKIPAEAEKQAETVEPKEDARVTAAKLNIGTVDVSPKKFASENTTESMRTAAFVWDLIKNEKIAKAKTPAEIDKLLFEAIFDTNSSTQKKIVKEIKSSNLSIEFFDTRSIVSAIDDGAVDEDTGIPLISVWKNRGYNNMVNSISIYSSQPDIDLQTLAGKTTQAEKPDYFDAFEEVEDEVNEGVKYEQTSELAKVEDKTEIAKQDDYEEVLTEDRATSQKKVRKTFTPPDSYKNYPIMELKDTDPVSIDDIIGLENIKSEIKENVITPLNEQGVNVTLKANNVDIPNGILLASVADAVSVVKATASETGIPILQVMDLETLKPMMKDIEKNYKDTGVKTIILIQGLDKFFGEQNSALAERNFRLVMNKCGEKGALLIATTDDKESVCKSFKKSGLLDKILEVQKPTLEDRKKYLLQYFGDKYLFSDLKNDNIINELAELMDGFNYADIDRVFDESARTAVSNSNDKVSKELALSELKEFTAERGMTPVDKNNKTGQYDTVMKRIPVTEDEPKSLDDLGGMPEIKEQLRKMYVEPMKKYDLLKAELGSAAIPDGAIFYGPAGNGKTLTAKTLARELGLPYYETKLSDIATSYVHEESKAIRKLAQQLRDKYKATGEMSVWFLDEFDSLGSERNGAAQHNKELVDTLLQEFNNPSEMGYILIAATNDIANVDSALKRRGRLGNWIPFHNPTEAERADVIKMTLAKTAFTRELSENQEYVEKLAKELDGNSMSDIVNVLNDAKRMKILDNKDFDEAVKTALDLNTKRQMAEFCNKAGLNPHTYAQNAFQSMDELGGMDDVKQQLQENIIDIWDPEVRKIFKENKIDLPGGVILEGPPGTGKTTIIETLARQMDVPLYKMDYSKQRDSEYIHAIARNVTDIFEKLRLQSKIIKKPVMLFFDEAEKFFPRHAERHQVEEVNTYKELMNTASENGIILTGATNHIDMVNQEIVGNPRRMGTVIHVDNPDDNSRQNLFEKIRDNKPILSTVLTAGVITELVALTKGLSIGKITDALNKLISQSIRHRQKIDEKMVIETFKKAVK